MLDFVSSEPRRLRRAVVSAVALVASAVVGVAAAAGAGLPEGRNYELVTPATQSTNVGAVIGYIGLASSTSADGRRLLYQNIVPLDGSDNGLLSSYVAERGPDGWTNTGVSPAQPIAVVDGTSGPAPFFAGGGGIIGFNGDLTKFVHYTGYSLLPENVRPGGPFANVDLYFRSLSDPGLSWITQPLDLGAQSSNMALYYTANVVGGGLHILFSSGEAEDPAYPSTTYGLYEWSPGDAHPTLVGLDENGVPLPGAGAGYGGQPQELHAGAISADGSKVVFESNGQAALYVRVAGDTIKIADGGGIYYEGTSNDASRVYFSTGQTLPGTTAPVGGGLYVYDVPADGVASHGHLEFITPYDSSSAYNNGLDGIAAIAQSGRHVYYVGTGSDNVPRLYDYARATGASTYVATLAPEDGSNIRGVFQTWGGDPAGRLADVSSDGEHLVFGSRATGIGHHAYDNSGFAELFRYDAGSGEPPVCISCRADGPATGDAVFSYFGVPQQPAQTRPLSVHAVSDDGSRTFFSTTDSLVAGDTNNAADVYEWVGGAPHLISRGSGQANSMLVGAGANGDDVFFTSFDDLVPGHTGGAEAIYDARVGAPPPSGSGSTSCDGDACQGSTEPAPKVASSGTAANGGGNATSGDQTRAVEQPTFAVGRLKGSEVRALRRGRQVLLTVSSNVPGNIVGVATAKIRGHRLVAAHDSRRLSHAPGSIGLRLRLSAGALRRLRSGASLRLRLVVTHSAVPRGRAVNLTLTAPSNRRAATSNNSRKGTR